MKTEIEKAFKDYHKKRYGVEPILRLETETYTTFKAGYERAEVKAKERIPERLKGILDDFNHLKSQAGGVYASAIGACVVIAIKRMQQVKQSKSDEKP